MTWLRVIHGALVAIALAYGAAVASYCSWPSHWRMWVRGVSDQYSGVNAVRILCAEDAEQEKKHGHQPEKQITR